MLSSSPRFSTFVALMIATAAASIVVVTPRDANAYCRTTTEPLPANYNPTKGCFTTGLPLFWRGACVGYSLNQDGSKNIPFEDAKRIIDESFRTWMAAKCTETGESAGIGISNLGKAVCGEVKYNQETANQNLIVFRDDGWPYNDPNSTLGLTTVTFNAETGEIYDADMEINASGRNLSTTDTVPANGFDLLSVVTHEAGHFFGLAHATEPSATMYASYKPGSAALRDLAADDVAGLCAIYPTPKIRIVSVAVAPQGTVEATACDPTPRHGLTEKCSEPLPESKSRCEASPISASSLSSRGGSGSSVGVLFGIAALGLAIVIRRRRNT